MGSATKHRRKRARITNGTPRQENVSFPVLDEQSKKEFGIKSQLQIQECSFVHWDVSEVTAVATSPCGKSFAVARANGSIELRRQDVLWAVSSVVYPDESDAEVSVSAMCFTECSRYVFVARLDGSLVVLSVTAEGLSEHVRLDPGGGAIWDVAVSKYDAPKQLKVAIGSDDGSVRFIEPDSSFTDYTVADGNPVPILPTDSAHYIVRISQSTNARVLSVSWAPPVETGGIRCVACGDSEGGIRWLNPQDGSTYGSGKISSVRGESTMIWSVVFVRQGRYVVCGDSRGMATIWSSSQNTLHQEVHVEGLHGSIWSSTLVSGENDMETVFFGSAGGGVGGLQSLASVGDSDRWMPLRGCRFHSHDVRALASFKNGTVVSGSMDARICLFDIPTFVDRKKIEWILPYHGCAGQPPVQFSSHEKLIVSRKNKGIDLWYISDGSSQSPSLRLRMNLKSLASSLISCAVSTSCRQIAVSSSDAFRLYKIWDGNGMLANTMSFGKVEALPVSASVESCLRGAVDLAFSGELLIGVTRCKQRLVLLQHGNLILFPKEDIGVSAMSLERLACNANVVAVSDSKGDVIYSSIPQSPFTPEALNWQVLHSTTDGRPVSLTAMCLSRSGSKLAVALSDFRVLVRSVKASEETSWLCVGRFPCVITSLSFASSEASLLVSGDKFCAVATALRAKKKDSHDEMQHVDREPFMLPFRDSVLGSAVLGPSKAVVVRRRWDLVQTSLPDVIPKDPFGS